MAVSAFHVHVYSVFQTLCVKHSVLGLVGGWVKRWLSWMMS